jgi:hypothetical protein
LAGLYVTGKAQEMIEARKKAPEVTSVTPSQATAGTELELGGYRLGWPSLKNVQVSFWQHGVQHITQPIGGGWQAKDLDNGLQQMKVVVPEGVEPGECSLVVEVNGFNSTPISFQIELSVSPPTIAEASSHWAMPGEVIWLTGTGFGISDEIEVTDSKGKIYNLEAGSTSSGVKTAFTLPTEIAEGEALIRVIEHRSGNGQASNPSSLLISNGPIPLELLPDWLLPVAAGQWLDLVTANLKPLESSEYAEVLLEQADQQIIVPIHDHIYPRIHIPTNLEPGEIKISTRTWRKNKPSPWSAPITYTLLAEPIAPTVMSIEVVGWDEPVYLGPSTPESFDLQPGDSLILRGKFPVASPDKLRLILKSNGNSISLTPSSLDPGSMMVKLPENLSKGEWNLILRSTENKASSRLPLCFMIK